MTENNKIIPLKIHCPNCKSQIRAKYDMSSFFLDGNCTECGHTVHSYAPHMADQIQEKMRAKGMTASPPPNTLQLVPETPSAALQKSNAHEQQPPDASGEPEAGQFVSEKSKLNMPYKHYKAGAGKSTIIGFSIIWLIPSLIFLVAIILHPGSQWWKLMLLILLSGAFLYVWLKSYRIEILGDELIYNSLFGGRKIIHKSEIGSVETAIGYDKGTSGTSPPIRLVITPKGRANSGNIIINMKIFDRKDVKILQKYLEHEV